MLRPIPVGPTHPIDPPILRPIPTVPSHPIDHPVIPRLNAGGGTLKPFVPQRIVSSVPAKTFSVHAGATLSSGPKAAGPTGKGRKALM